MYLLICINAILVITQANYYIPREENPYQLGPLVATPLHERNENYFGPQNRFPKGYGSSYSSFASLGNLGGLGNEGYGALPEVERRTIPDDYPVYQSRELPFDYFSQSGQPFEENSFVESRRFPKLTKRRKFVPTLPRTAEYEEEDYSNFVAGVPNRNVLHNSYGYSYAGYIDRQARMYPVMMYTLVQCIPCERAKHMLAVSYRDVSSHYLELGGDEEWQRQLKVDLQQMTGALTFPYIFLCGSYIGGASDLLQLHHNGQLRQMVNSCSRLPA